jgi:hypothetical protein
MQSGSLHQRLPCFSASGAVPSPAPLPSRNSQETFPLLHLPLYWLPRGPSVNSMYTNPSLQLAHYNLYNC